MRQTFKVRQGPEARVVRAENFRPNGLVVAHTAVTIWTVLGGAAAAGLAAAAVGRSHSGDQRAPFVLIRVPRGGDVRNELRRRGFAVRRGDTFPGPGPDWLRIAERFARCAPGLTGVARRTLRTNLRFIARRAVPQLYPADVPLPRERAKAPYTYAAARSPGSSRWPARGSA